MTAQKFLLAGLLVIFVQGSRSAYAVDAKPPEPKSQTFNDKELLDKIKKAGAELISSGKAKGTKDLCRQLKDRKQCDFKLAPVSATAIGDAELYQHACESIFVVASLGKPVAAKDATDPKEPSKEPSKETKVAKDSDPKQQANADDEWDLGFATAFAVSEDGVLTTSRHFFGDPEPSQVFLAADIKGNIFAVEEILAADEKKDTCFFRIAAKGLKPLPLGTGTSPGSHVRIVSHPGYFFYFFSAGSVGNYYKDDDEVTWLNVTADFGQGSSGAPAFDDNGNVVGQVASTFTLFAGGPLVGDPMVECRRFMGKRMIRVQKPAEVRRAAKDEKTDEPKPKDGKDPKEKDPKDDVKLSDQGDPQMVFKTCTPVEAMRSLITSGK